MTFDLTANLNESSRKAQSVEEYMLYLRALYQTKLWFSVSNLNL